VAPIIPAANEEEALQLANQTTFGLSGCVFGSDVERATRFAQRLEAGMAHVNDQPVNDLANNPFGGEKNSGIGRFGGDWAVEAFTSDKWMTVQHVPRQYPTNAEILKGPGRAARKMVWLPWDQIKRYGLFVFEVVKAYMETSPCYPTTRKRRPSFGGLITDFMQIKADSLSRANGGYLLLNDREVLANPGVWEALKRVLNNRELRIEEPATFFWLAATTRSQAGSDPHRRESDNHRRSACISALAGAVMRVAEMRRLLM
jgi:hypothetical protein